MREPRLRRPGMLPDSRAWLVLIAAGCLVWLALAAAGFLLWLALEAARR